MIGVTIALFRGQKYFYHCLKVLRNMLMARDLRRPTMMVTGTLAALLLLMPGLGWSHERERADPDVPPQVEQSDVVLTTEFAKALAVAADLVQQESSTLLTAGNGREIRSIQPASLGRLASQTQDSILSRLSSSAWSAMRDYVVLRFPRTPPPDALDPFNVPIVSESRARAYLEGIRQFVDGMQRLQPLALNLRINTIPPDADAQLKTVAVALPKARTNTVIVKVFRGLYSYRIEKPGYKRIDDIIDLVNDDRPSLECVLASETSESAQSSCRRR